VVVLLATPMLLDYLTVKQRTWFGTALRDVPIHNATGALVVVLLVDKQEFVEAAVGASCVTDGWRYEEPGQTKQDVYKMISRLLDIVDTCKKNKEQGGSEAVGAPTTASLAAGGESGVIGKPKLPSPVSPKTPGCGTGLDTDQGEKDASKKPAPKARTRSSPSTPTDVDKTGEEGRASPSVEHTGAKSPPPTQPKPRPSKVTFYPSQVFEVSTTDNINVCVCVCVCACL
jgi:hypothetical protein